MRLVILFGVASLVSFSFFLKRETKIVEIEVPKTVEVPRVLEVVRTEIIIKYVDRPVLVRPEPIVVKPSINWNKRLLRGVKFFEGYSSEAYKCSGGVMTIGYGCTDKSVVSNGKISENKAESLLRERLAEVRKKVAEAVTVNITDYQLNALTSFAFNCGMSNLKRLIEGEGRLNDGNYKSVEDILPKYRIAGGKVRKGLERRRQWELSLWKGSPDI